MKSNIANDIRKSEKNWIKTCEYYPNYCGWNPKIDVESIGFSELNIK